MSAQSIAVNDVTTAIFPIAEVKRRLQVELQKIADQGTVLRSEWEPLLDSKRVVGTVLSLEDLFQFKIPPDKIVRKGGYNSVNEAIDHMVDQIHKIWIERNKPKARK